MNESMPHILVVEDDKDLANLLQIHLTDAGYSVDLKHNGTEGLQAALNGDYCMLILDIMLPGLDGLEICKRYRQENQVTPILMLTARNDELDKVLGLEMGSDDYMTKPFSIRELLARVKAIFRRATVAIQDTEEETRFEFGDLVLDAEKRKVMLTGTAVQLTAKEFDLLHLFVRNPGRAYSRQDLLNIVWGYEYEGYSHTVNSHINRLRSKIESDASNPTFIKTVWGTGYRFVEKEEVEA